MKEIEIKNWKDFSEVAAHFDIGSPLDTPYLYRGQGKADWPLTPSLVRHAKSTNLDSAQTIVIEKAEVEEFQTQAYLYLPAQMILDRKDLISWWGFMQHYNAPTRVLDWTTSPFVAAYFAAEGKPDHAGAIWFFHVHTVEAYMEKTYKGYEFPRRTEKMSQLLLNSDAKPILYVGSARTQTERMSAQQTGITFSAQILADHDQIIAEAVKEEEAKKEIEVYGKLIISKELKFEFLRSLRSMNITARALFPGVDGLGRSVAELVTISAIYESGSKKKADEKKGE